MLVVGHGTILDIDSLAGTVFKIDSRAVAVLNNDNAGDELAGISVVVVLLT